MKDTIYTIPLTDAFQSGDECPFCFIHRKIEQDAISFTLGSSYMQDDMRDITDSLGFCNDHYKKLYDYGNRLGLAMILQTHYQSLHKDLSTALKENKLPSPSLLKKLSRRTQVTKGAQPSTVAIYSRTESCYVCDRIEQDLKRYGETFFYLFEHHEDFKELFLNSNGFCLSHFATLLDMAPYYLKEENKIYFTEVAQKILLDSLTRIEEDLSWFIDKYDYRNANEPWKNAKDAIPRSIQKVSSIYVQDLPFKESK